MREANKQGKPIIIVVTGAESTGKSALVEKLAKWFDAPYYPEYAREYLENLSRPYTFDDVDCIARKQRDQMAEALQSNHLFVFFDTWLIITKIWMEVVYNQSPEWIEKEICHSKVDLWLFCATDIPWIPDKLRENGGEMREKLSEVYQQQLKRNGLLHAIVRGTGEERFQNAINIIRNYL